MPPVRVMSFTPCVFITHDGILKTRCTARRKKRGLCVAHLAARDKIAAWNREHATRRTVRRWAKNHLTRLGNLTGRQWVRYRRANRAPLDALIKGITKSRAIRRHAPALS